MRTQLNGRAEQAAEKITSRPTTAAWLQIFALVVLVVCTGIQLCIVLPAQQDAMLELRAARQGQQRTAEMEVQRLHLLNEARKQTIANEADLLTVQEANLEAARQLKARLKDE